MASLETSSEALSKAPSKAPSNVSSKCRIKISPKESHKRSPRSSEGLQIAEPEPYPEAVNRYSPNPDTKLPQLQDQSGPDEASIRTRPSREHISFRPGPYSDQSGYGPTIEVPPDMVKKFFAHRRRKFLFIVVFTLFIVGTLIGSSIGGALYVQDKAEQSASESETSTNAADEDPASSSTLAPAEPSTQTLPSSAAYTARPFGTIQSINTTCPSTLLLSSQLEGKTSGLSGRYTYSCLDNTNILDEPNLMAFTAYTLEQCVDACSQYSVMTNKNETCKAVVINSQFRERYETGYGANCWLKGSADNASTGKAGYTAVVLREG
ncbi:hypothetical protein COCMIDRAFT_86783 [Bipolaris oryzae ATCC 44560]|uniref:Apple domain-containing protein n=1 Tax=Bipolaris oryzae ATCC 44560 TaxID=930090 RepID=W6ZA34_COCMI|nr:uncharacterized protein COCMIDRAFT_86783 [Bipolaris oryzae ATCC 44560]EUC48607.1 hypothetical protein COCMIDRAFT_86783 [Bipolaris oryzae ATCC 44560]